jgi:hypothetical protein
VAEPWKRIGHPYGDWLQPFPAGGFMTARWYWKKHPGFALNGNPGSDDLTKRTKQEVLK